MQINQINKYIKLIIVYLIYSLSSIFVKYASAYSFMSIRYWFMYLLAIFLLVVFAFLWQRILKEFHLFIAYSFKGTVIIFMLLWSVLLFNETISIQNIIGSIIIILGIFVVNKNVE